MDDFLFRAAPGGCQAGVGTSHSGLRVRGGWRDIHSVCVLHEANYAGEEAMQSELEGAGEGRHDACCAYC